MWYFCDLRVLRTICSTRVTTTFVCPLLACAVSDPADIDAATAYDCMSASYELLHKVVSTVFS